jgi:hypothetical protein
VAKSLNAPFVDKSPADLAPLQTSPAPTLDFKRLNGRHRMSILVAALTEEITVTGTPGGQPTGVDAVEVAGPAGPIARLQLDRDMGDAGTVAFWNKQLADVHGMKWNRDERLAEIILQQSDILSFLGLPVNMGPTSHPWTLMLIQAVINATVKIEVEVKRLFSLARPSDIEPLINPVIQTPGHSSFPSGHATESACVAVLLEALLLGRNSDEMRAIACRIAENRSVSGVHFNCDNVAGAFMGMSLAEFFLARIFGGVSPQARHVDHTTQTPPPGYQLAYRYDSYATMSAVVADYPDAPQLENTLNRTPTTPGEAVLGWLADEVAAECGI